MVFLRRPKLFVGGTIASVLLFVIWSRSVLRDIPAGWGASIPWLAEQGGGDDGAVIHLRQDAHRIPVADAFMEHFDALVNLPVISVAEAKQTCTWAPYEKVDFQFTADEDWVMEDRPDDEIDFRRRQWHAFMNLELIPYEAVKNNFSGRGIVIVAGNQDTLMRVKVILRALLKLGSTVPIEIHYFGDEMNETSKTNLAALYKHMSFNDLAGTDNIIQVKKNGFWINYQLKPAAVINSRFAEPLLLDSDNIPVIDPAELWESDTYREYGTVFWPDIARSWPQNPAWAITNTPCRMDEYEQESGQMLVDKRRFFYHLQLAAWMNNAQGTYYNTFLLGDKDCFRFAWHALKTRYGRPKKWLSSVGTVNDGYYCGHSFAQHYPDDGRVAFLHGGLVKTVSMEVMQWNREKKGGYFRSYKRSPTDESPKEITFVAIKFDGADYYPDHSPDFHASQCTDMFDVKPRDLGEILPEFERTFEEIGGYWQLDMDYKGSKKDT